MPCRFRKLNCPGGLGSKRQVFQLGVNHLLDGLPKRQTHLGKPDGMHMGPQQGFVGQIEAWRPDTARNHVLPPVEEVLVVAIQSAAVREHQPGLPLRPPGRYAARNWPGWVAHSAGGRGPGPQCPRQVPSWGNRLSRAGGARPHSPSGYRSLPNGIGIAPFPFAWLDHLGCVFAGLQGSQCSRRLAVESLEEGVDRRR